jgi:NADPH2:quinone reductase
MKAIRVHGFGEPEVMQLEDVTDPVPSHPAPGQVLVRVRAAGVNPVDAYIRAGKYGPVGFPYTPGIDAAGTIEKIAADVKNFSIGQRVYVAGSMTGTYAEFAVCSPDQIHRLPDDLSFAQGAAIGVPYGTAYRAMFIRAAARAGQTALIHGASGGVGLAAVQLAKAAGLTVIGTAGSEKGIALVRAQGADHVLNHTVAGYASAIPELTGGKGVDLIVEMLANVNLNNDLGLLALGGRVVVVGSRGPIAIDPRQTMGRDLSIIGMSLRNATPAELLEIHAALGAGLANKTLQPIIDTQFPLAQAAQAHRAVMESGSAGKIVLIP